MTKIVDILSQIVTILPASPEKDSLILNISLLIANKQIYQFPNKPTPVGADLLLLSDEESSHKTVNSSIAQIVSNVVNPTAQLSSTAQVTGLDGQLSAITGDISSLQSDVSTLQSDVTDLQADKMDKSANLADVANRSASAANLGFGAQGQTVITDVNYDTYKILTNPCTVDIVLEMTTSSPVNLPVANAVNSNRFVRVYNNSPAPQTIRDSASTDLYTIDQGWMYLIETVDNSTPAGAFGATQLFSTASARAQFSATNGVDFDPTTGEFSLLPLAKGQLIMGTDTDAQVGGLTSVDATLDVDTSANNSIDLSSWPLLRDKLIQGTNITLDKNSLTKEVKVSASGTPFSVGGGASFNIMSSATTTFSNSSYKPVSCTVANSVATNMTVNSNGSIACGADGVYGFAYILSARSSTTQNIFFYAIAKNGTVDTKTLQAIYLPTATLGTGTTVVVAGKFSLLAGDIVQLYVANGGSLSNDMTAQTMVCNCTQDLASSATLQSAYDNGSTMQGDFDTTPPTMLNGLSAIVFRANTLYCDLPLNYGNWSPTFSNLAGITGSITTVSARYTRQGKGVLCVLQLSLTASTSTVSFDTDLPMAANFTNATQANYIGGNVSASSPTVADGNIVSYASKSSNQTVTTTLNVTTGTGVYAVNLSYLYEVQS